MMKRILSFLLALLMVVIILPAPAHATDSTDATITPTETQSPDYSEDVGKYVKLNEAIVKFTVYGLTPSTGTLDEQIFMHADFLTDTIFQIAEWMMKDGKVWYRLTFYKGGLDNNSTFAQNFPAEPWFMQTAANELVFVDTCTVCGKPDCSGHTWCDICEEYDCGKDHTQPPAEPENPCACCESCTGAEGCTCECGACDFCEKVEDPDVPSISATVNGQTVTVSGAALPEGAELVVTPVENEDDILSETEIEGGFLWDIKVYDAEGNEWQPDDGEVVNLEIEFASLEDGSLIDIMHFLESPGEITKAIESGNAEIGDVNGCSTSVLDAFEPAISAYSNATATYNNKLAAVNFENVEITNGIARISTTGFSIYSWNGSYSHTRYESGSGDRFVLKDSNGQTLFVTRGQTVYLDSGHNAGNSDHWSFSGPITVNGWSTNDRPYVTVNNDATLGASCRMRIDYDGFLGIGAFDHTVYFVVVEERTVNFNANGGSCSTTSATAITDGGSRVQNVTLPNATRTGYTFRGWYTAASGGTKIGDAGAAYMPASSGGTLYAQWDAIEYTVKFDPNTANAGNGTVTGSMPTLYMTYDVENTLPENKFVNSADGYVFLGWATSPTGDVAHRDGAKIKNLTTTNNDTVTLYAKWKYALNSTVYIGINNSYHNPKGTYTAGGVTIDSYHAFPNEPAQMTADFDRVTDDNGAWRYDTASAVPLKNTAASYINGNIFNHREYGMTKVQGENTLGLHDPTGVDVRAMLKFTEADYNAMIDVWLTGMKNTLIGYGDPNMDWANAKAEDFVMIPYVIKLQNYDSWYIDMAVVEKELYTLGYNGNVENGYTMTFNGVAFPPSAQYHAGDVTAVVETPIGYKNNNLKVTKVVNGITFEAEFLYWEDEQGHKYGNGNAASITMDGNKTLKAVWKYPDQTEGALRVGKEVTVPAGTGLVVDTAKAFTINVTLSKSGTYDYTTYDANGFASGTGSFTGTSKSFALKAHEYVVITGIEAGTDYTVSETVPTGYVNKAGTITGKIQAGNTMAATIVNEPSSNKIFFDFNGGSNTNTNVTVVYGSTNYYDVSWLKPAREGHEFTGWYTAKESGTKVYGENGICIPGSYWNSSNQWIGTADLPLYAQWEEEKYTVTFVDDDGTTILSEAEYDYGTPAASIVKPADPSKAATAEYTYTFAGWTPAVTAVTGDAIYTAKYTETLQTYTVTARIDDGGEIVGTNPQTVGYGNEATVVFRPKDGYEIASITVNGEKITDFDPAGGQITRTITCDTTVEITTVLSEFTVTWVDGDGKTLYSEKVKSGVTPVYSGATPTKTATAQYTYTWDTVNPWSPTVVAVTGDATYTARFTSTVNKYTITWVDGNGSTLKTEQVEYGSMPAYTGATPTKTWTDEFAYTFINTWTPAIKTVTGDETYIAQFDATTRKYTVTWWQDKNENGVMDEATELLHTDSDVPYNTMLKYDGTKPTKEPNQQYWYNFAGWEKTDGSTFNAYDEIAVTGDMTFKAILNPTLMEYYVTWLVEGVEKDKDLWKYGDFPSYSGETPTKAEDDGYTYEWKGEWTPVVSRVVDTVIYSAVFEKTEKVFTISYDLTDDDGRTGTVNGTNPVEYTVEDGTITLINPTAAQPYYQFAGWTGTDLTDKTMTVTIPTGSTGNRAYDANYELIEYQISFDTNGADEATLAPVTYRYGDNVTLPTVSREGYTYKWKVHEAEGDWTGVTGEVTSGVMNHYGDVVLKAEWTANSYEIRFNQNADDAKGTMPNLEMTYDVAEKLTANGFQYTGYTFLGWTDDPDSTQVLYEDQQEVRNLTDEENGVVDLYAVWEINTVSLTIRTSSLDTNQSYVFQVEGTGLDGTGIDLKVILDANDSQTIVDLPAGTYTIRNEQGWSWRYEVKSETKDVHAATVVAEFSDWQNTAKIYWLNGYGNQQIKRKQNSN